jgi:hypothetical protein
MGTNGIMMKDLNKAFVMRMVKWVADKSSIADDSLKMPHYGVFWQYLECREHMLTVSEWQEVRYVMCHISHESLAAVQIKKQLQPK